MKLITQKELIDLLPAGDDVPKVLSLFEDFTPTQFREPGHCQAMIRSGATIPMLVKVENVPAYLITYHLTTDGGLWLDIAQTLPPGASLAALVDAVELLGQQHKSRYIRLTTARRGIVKVARLAGYQAEAVMMCKEVGA